MERAGYRINSRPIVAVMSLLLCLTSGCVGTLPFLSHDDSPMCGSVCQVVAAWNNEVILAPDPTRGGKPAPGIAGRIYLFGESIDFPRAGDGKIVVDLYQIAGQPQAASLLERWEFDRVTLSRLLRRDTIGWGYTIFLPWGSYKADVPVWNVLLKVRYEPANGATLFTENTITLNRPGGNNYRRTIVQQPLGSRSDLPAPTPVGVP
jgi:hypothetical protein